MIPVKLSKPTSQPLRRRSNDQSPAHRITNMSAPRQDAHHSLPPFAQRIPRSVLEIVISDNNDGSGGVGGASKMEGMRVLRGFLPLGRTERMSLCIGNFDGMHIGHQSLLARLMEAPPPRAVMSFEPHPAAVLAKSQPFARLYSWREKYQQAAAAGADALYLIRFTHTLAQITVAQFNEILFAKMGVRHLIVGENFRYGYARQGSIATLQQAAKQHGAQVDAAPLCWLGERVVSSGWVKEALATGDFSLAEKLLGRAWRLGGRVGYGRGQGRGWGIPTANLHLRFTPPCLGVFAGYAFIDGEQHRHAAAISIGYNPSVQPAGQRLAVEAHLLDFDGDLYGQRLALELRQRIRDEKRFESETELVAAMRDDIQTARELLA